MAARQRRLFDCSIKYKQSTNVKNNSLKYTDMKATNELSHAGQCLDIYLHTTREIYDRFTVPAINRVAKAYKAGEHVSANPEHFTKDVQEITPAIQTAARLVRKYDGLQPTVDDIETVTANYMAYIIDAAELQNS